MRKMEYKLFLRFSREKSPLLHLNSKLSGKWRMKRVYNFHIYGTMATKAHQGSKLYLFAIGGHGCYDFSCFHQIRRVSHRRRNYSWLRMGTYNQGISFSNSGEMLNGCLQWILTHQKYPVWRKIWRKKGRKDRNFMGNICLTPHYTALRTQPEGQCGRIRLHILLHR